MNDYSENYLKIQKLLKSYHNASLKNQFELATKLAHDLADETIKLEISSVRALKEQWLKNELLI